MSFKLIGRLPQVKKEKTPIEYMQKEKIKLNYDFLKRRRDI